MSNPITAILSSEGIFLGTIVPFLFVLTLVVFVHEMGHYLVGRWCGIGVKAFSIGFGPEIIGFNDRRGTRWKLSAIPLGGYVKFAGDVNASSMPDSEAMAEMTEKERAEAFHLAPVWKRAATVFAGPAANFILTIAVFSVFFAVFGRTIADPLVTRAMPGSAAEAAGFLPGDRFLRMDGVPITTFDDVSRYVSTRAGQSIAFVMEREGKEIALVAVPKDTEVDDALGNKVKVALIGVETNKRDGKFRNVAYGPGESVAEAVKESLFIASQTGTFLGRLVMGRQDKCKIGGPIKIAKMAGQAAKIGFDSLIYLAALLSIGIGIINLLPIPPLDGGHLLFYGIEAIIRRPVPEMAQELVYRIGGIIVLSFMLFVIFNDLFAC